MKCGQKTCDKEATQVFLWPGDREYLPVCDDCVAKAKGLAETLGFTLPVIPLEVAQAAAVMMLGFKLWEVIDAGV
jgi:hypothetical protein